MSRDGRVEPRGAFEGSGRAAAAGRERVAAAQRGDVEVQPDAGEPLAFFVVGSGEFGDIAEEEIADVQGVAAVGDHAVAGQEVLDAALEAGVTGPRIELLAAGIGHFEPQAVAQFKWRTGLQAPEAFQGDAAGVVRQAGNVVAHVLANTADERGRIGGAGTGRGAGQNEHPALRVMH